MLVNQGFASASFNIYQTYIVQIPGVSDAGGSFVVTVRTFVALIVMLFVGAYYKRLDARKGLFFATMCTAAGFCIYGLVDYFFGYSLLILCIGSVFTGMGYGLGGMVAVTTIMGSWFRGHLGRVAGIVGMGSGLAAMGVPMVAAGLVEHVSLSFSFFAEGITSALIAVFIAVFVRNKPQDVGAVPSVGKDNLADRRKHPVCIAKGEMPATERRVMMLAMMLLGAVSGVSMAYLSILMTSTGIGILAAAALTGICGAVLTFAKPVSGLMFDAIGSKNASLVFFAILLAGLVCGSCITFGGQWAAFFASVGIGIGNAISTTGMSVWSLELSSVPNRMKVVQRLGISFAFGSFLFNMMPGILKTVFGTYEITYVILAVLCVISAALVCLVYWLNTRRCQREIKAKAPGKAEAGN